MPPPYSATQVAEAKADWDYFRARMAGEVHAAAIIGSHDGEDSFDDVVMGDHDAAKGRSQWHKDRRALILKYTGIDVWNATPDQQREAMFREMTESWSWYKHVWTDLMAATTVEQAVTVLVVKYEQSASQARDISRRTGLANYWLQQFGTVPTA